MEFAFDLKEFFRSLLIYHYVFFGVASFLTIAMMILGVILRRHLWAALLCFGLSFFGFSIGVPVGGYFLESYLRPSSLQNVTVHRLEFSKAIVFTADIKNFMMRLNPILSRRRFRLSAEVSALPLRAARWRESLA